MSAIIVTHRDGEDRWEGSEMKWRMEGDDGIVFIVNRIPVLVTQAQVDEIENPVAKRRYQEQVGQTILSDEIFEAIYANGYWQRIKMERDEA